MVRCQWPTRVARSIAPALKRTLKTLNTSADFYLYLYKHISVATYNIYIYIAIAIVLFDTSVKPKSSLLTPGTL